MANIFQLFGTIFVDNSEADKSIDSTTKKAESSGSKVGSAFSSIAKGAAVVGTAAVAGAAALGTAAYKMASDTAAAADEVDKMSQKLGMSREGYQEWDYVLSQAGVDINTMQTGMKSLVKNMDATTEGNKTATANFEKLGLTVTDSSGKMKTQEQMFNETVTALQNMEDGTEKARLAQEMFGKQGQEMLPLLNGEAGSIEELKNKANELGMVMGDDAIDAGVKFTDTMDTMKRSLGGAINSLGATVMPIVQKVLDLIIGKLPLIQKLFEKLSPILESVFSELLPPLFDLVETIFPVLLNLIETLLPPIQQIITAILPVIVSLIQQLLPPIMKIIETVLPILVNLINAIMPLVVQILDTILPVLIQLIEALLPPIIQIIEAVLPVVIQLLQTLLPPILKIVNAVLPVLIDLINTVMPLVVKIIEAVLPIVIELIEKLLPPILKVIDLVLPVLINLIESILPLVTTIIEAILPVLLTLLDVLMPLLEPILDILLMFLEPLMQLLNMILPPIIALFKNIIEKVMPPLQKVFEAVAGAVSGNFKNAFDGIKKVFENVKGIFTGIIDFVKNVFTGNWKGAWDAVVKIFGNIFDGIKNIFKVPINWIIDGLNLFIKGLNKLQIPDWVPGVGGMGLNIAEIKRLRIGLDYVPYDEFPALLHKGERVLTASESKTLDKTINEQSTKKDAQTPISIKLELKIENFNNNSGKDIEALGDDILTVIEESLRRKGAVFA
ncbi:MAG: hypothetical protein A2Y17_12315 [Clostridiales bacterium GWF2_38_85]|nr:MAG: hypothetical protein A2Y17_12315 [Clostridiales bacterium GWF2_38_85]